MERFLHPKPNRIDIDFIPTSQYWAAAGTVLFNHVSSLSTLRNRQLQWSDGVTTTTVPLHGAPDATVAFSQGIISLLTYKPFKYCC